MLYAQSASCRWQTLSKYFDNDDNGIGGEEIEKCETCDNCVRPISERFDVQIPPGNPTKAEQEELLETLRRETEAREEIAVGESVELPKLGAGKVEAVAGDKVEVVFAGGKRKTFKSEFVRKTGV